MWAFHESRIAVRFYRSLVETLPDGVGVVGLDGQFLLCNEHLTSMLGHPTGSLVGQSQLQLFDLQPGTYFIGAIADFSNAVRESNEVNNALAGNTVSVK